MITFDVFCSIRLKLPTLLVRGPSVRDVACVDPSSLLIKLRSGTKTGDVLKLLKKMNTDSNGDVIFHVDTNDCATKYPTTAENIRVS